MNEYQKVKSLLVIGAAVLGLSISACGGGEGPPKPPPPAPPEYADKHMPEGYWNNPEIVAEVVMEKTGNPSKPAPGISVERSKCNFIRIPSGFGE